MAAKGGRAARAFTDARLKAERAKTDHELARRSRTSQTNADQVLQTARDRAAGVLRASRRRSDDGMRRKRASSAERAAVDAQRAREDEVIRREYARADQTLAGERAQRARLVAELLSTERRDTDRSLLLERASADQILARRDEFLGMVSHDLRNELTAMALSLTHVLQNAAHDERGRKVFRAATTIQRINLRMSRLIADLLDVASLEAGKFTVVTQDVRVSTAVDEIVASFAPIASAKGISLTIQRLDTSLSACFDRQRIQQVLGNLLVNALTYTPAGGAIVVRAQRKGRAICFAVSDEGPGIDAARLERVFDRYSRGPGAERHGLGLGLYIARRIVEAHEGRIWAESTPGRGSTFRFTVPLRAARGQRLRVGPPAVQLYG